MFINFVKNNFSLILAFACLTGFFLPDIGEKSNFVILSCLFTIIFSSFFQLTLQKDIFINNAKKAFIYLVIRYLIIPVIGYFLVKPISEFYGFAVFFLLLLPAAVASPAFTGLFINKIDLSIIILVFSSFLVVISIPLLTPLFYEGFDSIDVYGLSKTLIFTIVLPFAIHFPLRKSTGIKKIINSNLPVITVVCLSVIYMVAISRNKITILEDIPRMLEFLCISLLIYSIFYYLGKKVIWKAGINDQITYAISSGMNNVGLGVALALLYFPKDITVFLIICQITWLGVLIPAKYWISRIILYAEK